MLTEPGLPTRRGTQNGPSEISVPYPEMPEMSVFPRGNKTLLLIAHPAADRAAHATSGVQCDTWAGRHLDTQSAWLAPTLATAVMHHSRDNGSSSWVCGLFFFSFFGKLIFFLLFFGFILLIFYFFF